MKHKKTMGVVALLIISVVYYLVYIGMERNLAAMSQAIASGPVTLVVDAGHGGEDGGTLSPSGIRESDINLSIALRLEQLCALCGIEPSMIRREDASVSSEGTTISERKVSDLKNRVRFVNETTKPVLISIHQNHFPDSKYFGAQVFYSPTAGSKVLAEQTQLQLRSVLDPQNHRQCKLADSVYLMQKIRCPGILVECGFLSNSQETDLLTSDTYQKKLACAISCGLFQYLEKGEMEVEI